MTPFHVEIFNFIGNTSNATFDIASHNDFWKKYYLLTVVHKREGLVINHAHTSSVIVYSYMLQNEQSHNTSLCRDKEQSYKNSTKEVNIL